MCKNIIYDLLSRIEVYKGVALSRGRKGVSGAAGVLNQSLIDR